MGSGIRIRARVSRDASLGDPHAVLETFVGTDSVDTLLNDEAAGLQRPVTFEDASFGTFTLDRRVDWFTAEVIWGGRPVALHLSDPGQVDAALQTAHALWRDQDAWQRRIRDYATRELLPVKNDYWLDDVEAELTPEDFAARMTLESIVVRPDGFFEFWHNDGDLFRVHSILVKGSLAAGPTAADIPG